MKIKSMGGPKTVHHETLDVQSIQFTWTVINIVWRREVSQWGPYL